jgi:hypothetical protein
VQLQVLSQQVVELINNYRAAWGGDARATDPDPTPKIHIHSNSRQSQQGRLRIVTQHLGHDRSHNHE